MKLSVKGMGLASMITWAGAIFFVGAINRCSPRYGVPFLQMAHSLYPAYHPMTGGRSVLIVTGYAMIDGVLVGVLFALVYNIFAKEK